MNTILEQFKQTLIESWNATDKAIKDEHDKFCEEHKNETWDSDNTKYSYKIHASEYFIRKKGLTKHEMNMIYYGMKQAQEENEKAAEKFVKNLEARIKSVVGEIEEITHYSSENGNGWQVVGTAGKAHVLQIMAGGYNIQRLHIRNIIKVVK